MKKIFLLFLIIILFTACSINEQQKNIVDNTNVNDMKIINESKNIVSTQIKNNNNDLKNTNNVINESNTKPINETKKVTKKRKYEKDINCRDCFHNIGFIEIICESNGKYNFERQKNENDNSELFDWTVYVLDEKTKYNEIQLNNEAKLINDGTINIKKGQYIYIHCSYNPNNNDLPPISDQLYKIYID